MTFTCNTIHFGWILFEIQHFTTQQLSYIMLFVLDELGHNYLSSWKLVIWNVLDLCFIYLLTLTHSWRFLPLFLLPPFHVNQTFSGGIRGRCLELVSPVCPQASSLLWDISFEGWDHSTNCGLHPQPPRLEFCPHCHWNRPERVS